jgi:DnaK suppressor protein
MRDFGEITVPHRDCVRERAAELQRILSEPSTDLVSMSEEGGRSAAARRSDNMSTSQSVGTLLQERLDQLLRRVGNIEGDLRSPHDRDSQERAGELENDEVLEELDDMSRAEVRQIREALKRLENGSYGICARCGRPISAERLAALPATVTCVGCLAPS